MSPDMYSECILNVPLFWSGVHRSGMGVIRPSGTVSTLLRTPVCPCNRSILCGFGFVGSSLWQSAPMTSSLFREAERLHEWRIGIGTFAQHDNGFAMRISCRQEFSCSGKCEVAGHTPPDVMELICPFPDVCADPGDPILIRRRIKRRCTLQRQRSDTLRIREYAYGRG